MILSLIPTLLFLLLLARLRHATYRTGLRENTGNRHAGPTNGSMATAKIRRFFIWALSFIRHSTFVLRHFMNLV